MVKFGSGERHWPASQSAGRLHSECLLVCVSLCVCACAHSPVVAHCLFSHVMRHVGACLQSLYLLSSLRKSLARCTYLPRQSPLSNGSPRAEGSAGTHWEHFASFGRYCPQEMNLWTQSQMMLKQFVVKSLSLTQTRLQLRRCYSSTICCCAP